MGECGCDLQVHRCSDHANDVVVVLSRDDAEIAVDWIRGKRPGVYPEDVIWGRALDRVVRAIRAQGELG